MSVCGTKRTCRGDRGPHVAFTQSGRLRVCSLNGLLDSARKPRPFVFALESVSLGFTLDLAPLGRSRLMIFVSLSRRDARTVGVAGKASRQRPVTDSITTPSALAEGVMSLSDPLMALGLVFSWPPTASSTVEAI